MSLVAMAVSPNLANAFSAASPRHCEAQIPTHSGRFLNLKDLFAISEPAMPR